VNSPSCSPTLFSTQQSSTVLPDLLYSIHSCEEREADWDVARGEGFEFGLSESEAGEEELDEG